MAIDSDPVVGNWYEHADNGERFEVIDIDEDRGVVEVQYVDGDLEELDMDEWYEMDLEPSDEPETDWVEQGEDAGTSETETWSRPKRGGKRPAADDYEEDDDPDWEEDDAEESWDDE